MQPPSWLRDPAYTGARRCWPCAVVNVAIVAVVSVALAVAGFPLVALAVAVLGVGAVWARGYVVPFTPRFAPHLVDAIPGANRVFATQSAPAVPGSLADTHGSGGTDAEGDGTSEAPGGGGADAVGGDSAASGETVLDQLVAAGVVVPDGDALALDDEFAGTWQDAIADARNLSIDELASAVETALSEHAAGEPVSVRVEGGARGPYVVVARGEPGSLDDAWLTRPVAIAELAALDALSNHAARTGATIPAGLRLQAAAPLRLFLESCPACGGDVVETTTVDCCGGPAGAGADPDTVLACTECESRLFTLPE